MSWLILIICAFFTVVNGNYTMHAPLNASDIVCLEKCKFFQHNQTVAIINITDPGEYVEGVAYYTTPIRMKDPRTRTVASFNTSFTFREEPMYYNASPDATDEDRSKFRWGDGFTFMMTNSSAWIGKSEGKLGIFSANDADNPKVVAVEFDNYANKDTDLMFLGDHVGLDIASAKSYCTAFVEPLGISFWKRDVIYSWIEYDGTTNILQVRVANTSSRPVSPLVNCSYDLYDAVDEKMWIGFSGSHGTSWCVYYIYNWTFTSFGISPHFPSVQVKDHVRLIVGSSSGSLLAVFLILAFGVCLFLRRKRAQRAFWDKEGLVEMGGMPEFISYKELSAATKRFSDESKLGEGGFGSVYKGVLPKNGAHVAVKKVSNDSKQGEREFLAEVQIISQLRHRNVVELTGFCRDRGKFLLVYELMPKGSLDQALFKPNSLEDVLSWSQRWKIVSGTAAALYYLHEGWRQQVIHRDVKPSNIMLDEEYIPKLGDFGLARLVDHANTHVPTTGIAGTYGYIAPEATGGRFTDKTDVFAFGAVVLEIACGRRALDVKSEEDMILVDMVWRHWKEGELLSVVDPMLQGHFDADQMCTVLKMGLRCSNPDPSRRPSMRQVVQVLAGDLEVPDLPSDLYVPELYHLMPLISITNDLLSCSTSLTSMRLKSSDIERPYPVS
ncbi:hypothetical protein M758_10G033400 [Ceratodon purpureus]|nr:hypothetical protein M758_10G033400 [Ceratodon purpureus]